MARRAARALWLVLAALLSCSCRLGSSDVNIGIDDAALPDEPSEPCAATWGPLEPLAELNTPDPNCGGHITPDGLTLYFDSQIDSNWELFVTSRSDARAPFAIPTPLTELNTSAGEADPATTPDELELFFTSERDGSNCLYRTARSSREDAWGPPSRLDALCAVPAVAPSISADGLTLYYNTAEGEFGVGTVMVSVRASREEAFAAPEPVPALAAGQVPFGYPSLSPDGLSLFVSAATNQLDIWLSRRESTGQSFGAPAPVDELNSAALDGDVSVTGDGSQLFLASGRGGSVDLYVSRRSCP